MAGAVVLVVVGVFLIWISGCIATKDEQKVTAILAGLCGIGLVFLGCGMLLDMTTLPDDGALKAGEQYEVLSCVGVLGQFESKKEDVRGHFLFLRDGTGKIRPWKLNAAYPVGAYLVGVLENGRVVLRPIAPPDVGNGK